MLLRTEGLNVGGAVGATEDGAAEGIGVLLTTLTPSENPSYKTLESEWNLKSMPVLLLI
jgi:hypothetical protein